MSQPIVIDVDGDFFLVQIPYAYNYLIQDLPERKWLKSVKKWRVPANWRSKDAMGPLAKKAHWTEAARDLYAGIEKPTLPGAAKPSEIVGYPFVHQPFHHQMEAYLKAYHMDYYALFFEQGLGKTKTSIDLMGLWRMPAILIICPVSIRQVWQRELPEHWPPSEKQLDIQLLDTKRMRAWDDEKIPVLICGVESLSQGGAFEIATQFCRQFVLGLILDESTRVKNHQATRTERTIDLALMCVKRLILTGTPVTQGLQDLYSQFQVLNPSTLALTSFYAFRNRYCVMGGFDNKQIVAYKNVPELMELIEPWSLRREKEDCLDLPEKTFQTRRVSLSAQQKKAYDELKKNLRTVIQKEDGTSQTLEVQMVLEAYLRLQQICGGFYPIIDENGELIRVDPIPGPNPKMNELLAVMDEIGPRKVIIWARFRAEVELIAQMLSNEREVVQFHGGLTEQEKKASVEQFQAGTANVLIATQQSASYGLTLTAAHTAIYYSMGFSLEEFLQSQDRIHRIGQTISCDYTLLCCAGTVDENVVQALSDKKSLADFVSERIKGGEEPF